MPEVSDFFTYGGEESRALTCGEFHDALGSAVPEDVGVEVFFYGRYFCFFRFGIFIRAVPVGVIICFLYRCSLYLLFLWGLFCPVDIFPAHLKDFVAIPVVGCCEEYLASFGYASESVFGVVTVDGGFSFCLFFDQVSVIVVDVLYFIACFGVFLCDYLIILVIRYGDGSVLIGMSALIDLTETSWRGTTDLLLTMYLTV